MIEMNFYYHDHAHHTRYRTDLASENDLCLRIYCAVDFCELVGRRAFKSSLCFLFFLGTACPVRISFALSWILLTNVSGILTEASIGGLEAPIGPR